MIAAQCWHPSVFIVDEMEMRGWTIDDLAAHMGGDQATMQAALDLYISVHSPNLSLCQIADALALAFGIPADHFTRLERDYWAWVKACEDEP